MDWAYYNLINGRLVDDDGHEGNVNWPSFSTIKEAGQYMVDNNIRGSVKLIENKTSKELVKNAMASCKAILKELDCAYSIEITKSDKEEGDSTLSVRYSNIVEFIDKSYIDEHKLLELVQLLRIRLEAGPLDNIAAGVFANKAKELGYLKEG